MKINDAGLAFTGSLTKRAKTDMLVLHHTAEPDIAVEKIHESHIRNGWIGIGYNYYVRTDGSVWIGRPDDCVGAHAQGYNSRSVGVAAAGNYETTADMPEVQKEALKQLASYITGKYPTITKVVGHRDLMATACPGKYYPFDEISAGDNGNADVDATAVSASSDELIAGYGDDPAAFIYQLDAGSSEEDKVKALQVALTLDGDAVSVDGRIGSETETACKKHMLRVGSRGHCVVFVQRLLCPDAVDAIYGKNTRDRVRAWQDAEGKAPDGVVGVKTYRGLCLDGE